MDIATLKQQARTLEQQGDAAGALALYRQLLEELEAMGALRQELPLLIKVGDLHLKCGEPDAAIDQYERAAAEYASQGATQPVISLCLKILRADPKAVGAYLRLARQLLEAGFTEGARQVLLDYARRAKLEKTREGLERLAGQPEPEVASRLARAIESAEQRLPPRAPKPAPRAPAPPPPAAAVSSDAAPAEPPPVAAPAPSPSPAEPEPQPTLPSPADSAPRLTVPVGALDAEPPSLLEQRPPESRPDRVSEWLLDRPVEAAEPESLPPSEAPPPPPPAARGSGSMAASPGPAAPSAQTLQPESPAGREERAQMGIEEPAAPERVSRWGAVRREPAARGARWRWVAAVTVLAATAGALVWFRIIPAERLSRLLSRGEPQEPAPSLAPLPAPATPDTVMARDTAGAAAPDTAAAAGVAGAPSDTQAGQPARPRELRPAPPALPAGVSLSRPVVAVQGLKIESVEPLTLEGQEGFRITQLLPSGQRILLEEFPSDTAGSGEIGITSLPGDTVVGHVRASGLEVTLKGVLAEDLVVQLLLQLVEVRPPR